MAELVSLWAAKGTKEEEGTREREHKRTGLFSEGFDFSTDSGAATIKRLWRIFT